jgi:hypothetical protein
VAKKTVTKPKKVEWKGFHNVNLTKEDELLFEAWQAENPVALNWVEALTDEGYKVSFDYDAHNQGFRVGLYANSHKLSWVGYTLTAWAGDIQTALNLVCFKHYIMCKQDWDVAPDVNNRGTSSYG